MRTAAALPVTLPAAKETTTAAEGVLLVDKPAGVSSHDAVAIVRRALREKRVGHAGTLDPFATGLLVVLVGRATRLMQYILDEPKVYEATIEFGAETDTEDPSGAVIRSAARPTRAATESAARALVGTHMQVPPAYSAKRIGGERAYDLARAGRAVSPAPVRVTVHECSLSGFQGSPDAVERCTMHVSCGGGTYVRSLARDLAVAANSAAHLTALRRVSAGGFCVANATSLADVQRGALSLAPPLRALEGHAREPLSALEVAAVVRGMSVEARTHTAGAPRYAVLLDAGAPGSSTELVAFAERMTSPAGERWQPRVVLRDA